MASPAPFPLASNLNSLLNGQAKALGLNGSAGVIVFEDVVAPMSFVLSVAPTTGGDIEVYVIVSEDNVTWTDGISPTSTSDQAGLIKTAQRVGVVNTATGLATTYIVNGFSIYSQLGYMPMFWSIVVSNKSGSSFAASGHIAQHSLQNYTTPVPVQYA